MNLLCVLADFLSAQILYTKQIHLVRNIVQKKQIQHPKPKPAPKNPPKQHNTKQQNRKNNKINPLLPFFSGFIDFMKKSCPKKANPTP